MRESQIRMMMHRRYPVIVKVPKCRRLELARQGVIVQKYFEGRVVSVFKDEPCCPCLVTLLDGLGRYIQVRAGSILRPKGLRDGYGRYGDRRVVTRTRASRDVYIQMGLFSEKL